MFLRKLLLSREIFEYSLIAILKLSTEFQKPFFVDVKLLYRLTVVTTTIYICGLKVIFVTL